MVKSVNIAGYRAILQVVSQWYLIVLVFVCKCILSVGLYHHVSVLLSEIAAAAAAAGAP